MRTYKGKITELPENGVFVFGSNTEGRHGKGAALIAKNKFGAVYGNPIGFYGKSYAIMTKDLTKKTHPSISKMTIDYQIYDLYAFAKRNPQLDFYIAYSGKGKNLNGYTNKEMAERFVWEDINIPDNIIFEEEFSKLIQELL